jgi:glycosyltransferase involved in cell wall biosynthesis
MAIAYFYCIINPTRNNARGGGEETARRIIANLTSCEYEVKIITPANFQHPNEADLCVYQDIFNDPMGSEWFTTEQYMEMLGTTTPFLISECAYSAVTTKPYGQNSDYNEALTKFSHEFFQRATKVVLASPLHKNETEKFLGFNLNNCYLYLREVNTNVFKDRDVIRDIPYLHVGSFNYAKGTDEVVKKFGDKGLVLIGEGSKPPGSYLYMGYADNSKLPIMYSRALRFVHLPRWKESFSRTTAEAALCGCKLITNSNVGAMSWGVDLSNPQVYKDSKDKFCEMIKSLR